MSEVADALWVLRMIADTGIAGTVTAAEGRALVAALAAASVSTDDWLVHRLEVAVRERDAAVAALAVLSGGGESA